MGHAPINPAFVQLGYVTNDLDKAMEFFATMDVPAFHVWRDAPVHMELYGKPATATLNLGFLECQRDHYADGERAIHRVIEPAPLTRQPVLIAAAYMTLACNLMGQQDFKRADLALAQAISEYPQTSSGYELWADLKEHSGDHGEAQRLHQKARQNSIYFENYAEVAMLYFELSWRNGAELVRSRYSNPNLPQPLLNQP